MNYNSKTLVHFKSDGVVWEMKFEEHRTGWMGSPLPSLVSYVRGGCYQGAYKNQQPCFRNVSYNDPKSFVTYNNGVIEEVEFNLGVTIEALYENHYIATTLADVQPKERIH